MALALVGTLTASSQFATELPLPGGRESQSTVERASAIELPGMEIRLPSGSAGIEPRLEPQRVLATASAPTITSFTAAPSPPQPFGTQVTWTVTATGGVAPLQYRFWRLDDAVWYIVQDYSTNDAFSWTPGPGNVGQHDLAVWVKNAGSAAQYDAAADTGFFSITSPVTISSITASPALPRPSGTPITWTVAAAGPGSLLYRFYRYDGVAWNMVQDYSSNNTYTWTPAFADIGQHDIAVWVKRSLSAYPFDASRDTGMFSITNPVHISSLSANPTLPRPFGTTITFTASVTAVPGPPLYRFWRLDAGAWNMVQDYSTTRTYSWTPAATDLGQHDVAVWVKNAGSSNAYDALKDTGYFNITGTASISALMTGGTFPRPAGTAITWTATATGNPGPLEYEFWRSDGGVWNMVQAYAPGNTYTWIPTQNDVGQHDVAVWVRSVGSTTSEEAARDTGLFSIQPPGPLSVTGIVSAPPMPREQGSIILWIPQTTGGQAPLSYRFWKYTFQTQVWSIVQDWSTNGVFTWSPTAADVGDYEIAVWVKNAGSAAAYDGLVGSPRVTVTPPTTDIVRFLEQAAWGPTDVEIERVRQMGKSAWIDDQFTKAPTGYAAFPPVPDNPRPTCTGNCQRDNYSMYPLQRQFFLNALYGQDQLRQRVAWALHALIVTSGLDLNLPSWYQPYLAIIYNDAFGNYRQLLYDITLNPGMGDYLNLDTSTANLPNENYAREIMQLFSLGTDLLNIDGTPQTLADGTIIPTYDQFTVTELARALTGWHFAPVIGPGITNYRDPMIGSAANHDLGSKTLLNGFVLPPGQSPDQDLNGALDNIFNHGNVGPYVSEHLIKYLATSNPSPAYVQRIATVFNDNGSGVRGDLKAVVKAILLDAEARQPVPASPDFGHLKDPVLLGLHLLRATNATSANGQTTSDGYLNPTISAMGQDVFRPATVFSYYPAFYQAPGTTIVGPEFGILDSTTALRRVNFINKMVYSNIPATAANGNAPNGTSIDLSVLMALAVNPAALIQELNRTYMHDSMSAQMQTAILNVVSAIPASSGLLRAQAALYLVASSSQYQVER